MLSAVACCNHPERGNLLVPSKYQRDNATGEEEATGGNRRPRKSMSSEARMHRDQQQSQPVEHLPQKNIRG